MGLALWLLMFPKDPAVIEAPKEPAPACVEYCRRVCTPLSDGTWFCREVEYAEK